MYSKFLESKKSGAVLEPFLSRFGVGNKAVFIRAYAAASSKNERMKTSSTSSNFGLQFSLQ